MNNQRIELLIEYNNLNIELETLQNQLKKSENISHLKVIKKSIEDLKNEIERVEIKLESFGVEDILI